MRIMMAKPSEDCYGSLSVFTDLLAQAFSDIGVSVERVITVEDILKAKENCDAILVFNGNMELDIGGGELFFNTLEMPVINFIVDHPRMHLNHLKPDLKNYYVVCLDEEHERYINKYHHNIKKSMRGWLHAGVSENVKSFKDRSIDVLFIGSYGDENIYLEKIGKQNETVKNIAFETINYLIDNPDEIIENAFMRILADKNIALEENDFLALDSVVGTDICSFLRAYYRHLLIAALTEQKIPVTVCGSGWESLRDCNANYLKINRGVPFEKSKDVIADSKVVLNISPWFMYGVHDRVITSLYNKAVCVTDAGEILKRDFENEKDMFYYPLGILDGKDGGTGKLCSYIEDIISNEANWTAVSGNGYEKARKLYKFEDVASEIIQMITA